MTAWTARRLLSLAPLLVLISALQYLFLRLTPGDPLAVMYGEHITDAALRAGLSESFGLNGSWWMQYLHYLGSLVRGDLGQSYRYPDLPVAILLGEGVKRTLALASLALIVALPAGAMLAIVRISAVSRVGAIILDLILLGTISVPAISLAALLVSTVAGHWPIAGWGDPRQAVLPTLCLAIPAAGHLGRLTQALLRIELDRDYCRCARAKGLRRRQVIVRHALPNVLAPLITSTAVTYGGLLAGSVVLEELFAIPGMGRLMVGAVLSRDYPVVAGASLIYALVFTFANLAAAIACTLIDPRPIQDTGTTSDQRSGRR